MPPLLVFMSPFSLSSLPASVPPLLPSLRVTAGSSLLSPSLAIGREFVNSGYPAKQVSEEMPGVAQEV